MAGSGLREGSGRSVYETPARPDIQGLRALAVLAVVLYHAGVPGAAGGYVGVDIFFVISGFLITRKLYREIDTRGALDIWRFISDRAKRLLPNAALVLVAVLVAAALAFPFHRHRDIAGDVRAAALFVSNFRFAANAVDYFSIGARPGPVMHFWSLSVEEQFYAAWPALLVLLVRVRPRAPLRLATLVLVVVCVVSFALSLLAIRSSQPGAYFLTWNRAWQLGVGGLAGAWFHRRLLLPVAARAACAWAGLAAALGAIALYSDETLYPGAWALAPTLGTAAMLAGLDAPGAGLLRRALSTRWAVWIGDRSYSLYLWHWPVLIVGAQLFSPSALLAPACLLATLVLAALAYRYVEYPLHKARWRPPRWWQQGAMPLATGLALAVLAWGLQALPRPAAVAQRMAAITAAGRDFGPNYADGCHLTYDQVEQPPCAYGVAGGPEAVLFGDSHAAQWFTPLREAAVAEGWAFRSLTKTSCPSADVTIWYPPARATYAACDAWRRAVMVQLLAAPPALVFIANYSHYGGWIEDRDTGAVLDGAAAARAWQAGLMRTVGALVRAGSRVVLIRDNPALEDDYRDCLAERRDCGRPRAAALDGIDDDAAVAAAFGGAVTLLDFTDRACDATTCRAEVDGRIIYQDQHHFTATWTGTLWRDFAAVLRAAAVGRPRRRAQAP